MFLCLRRGRESSTKGKIKGGEKKKQSRKDTAPLRRAIFTRRVGFSEFQPWDVIAPADYSDLLGYYGSCVRKLRTLCCMDFFSSFQHIPVNIFQNGIGHIESTFVVITRNFVIILGDSLRLSIIPKYTRVS